MKINQAGAGAVRHLFTQIHLVPASFDLHVHCVPQPSPPKQISSHGQLQGVQTLVSGQLTAVTVPPPSADIGLVGAARQTMTSMAIAKHVKPPETRIKARFIVFLLWQLWGAVRALNLSHFTQNDK